MKHVLFTPFLRDLVDDSYAFFWQTYDSPFRIINKGRKMFLPSGGSSEAADIDTRGPLLTGGAGNKRYYAPLRRDPVMHRTFCEINDNRGIIRFASKYGMMGFTRSYRVCKRDTRQPKILLAESLARWKYELEEMKRLVHLWELIQNKRLSLLGALISREDDGIYITLGRRRERIDDSGSTLVRKWDTDGEQHILDAALRYLTTSINRKLSGSVFPSVLPSYQRKVYLLPGNLLSAMWLMFLWEVIGETRPRHCPGCGDWFDPKRSTRVTCSDRCRKRKSREHMKPEN